MGESANEATASRGTKAEDVIFLSAGAGHRYDAGPMHAVFKADGAETDDRYCVSEWWLEAGQPGPGPHSHEGNEELFYVLEGAMSFLVGAEWIEAPRGSFLRIPAGRTHDFGNRSETRASVLNVFIPGGFETLMPRIVAYMAGSRTARGERARPSATAQLRGVGGDCCMAERDRLARRMDFRLELIPVPVSDVDRAKAFYAERAGFTVDNDVTVREGLRFIQLTPPGSGCSVSIGEGITDMKPGSLQGLQLVVDDVEAARDELSARGLEVSDVQDFPWGRFVFFSDPDGNGWAVQQIPDYGEGRTQPEGS